MNCVYFACLDCKNYIDAGYRWCSHHLEHPGIVTRNEPISVDLIFEADEYWNGMTLEDENSQWLRRELPQIKRFLDTHRIHKIIYAEAEEFLWNDQQWDWADEEQSEYVDRSPRFYAERLGYKEWCQVEADIEDTDKVLEPFWWHDESERNRVRQKFESIVNRQRNRRHRANE